MEATTILTRGDTLDASGSETNWGNPRTTKAMIDTVRAAGFKSMRVPVSWDTYVSGNDKVIASWFLDRVEEVVRYGLDNGMYVIVNVHHTNGWEATTYLISKNLQPCQVIAHAMSYRAVKMHQPEQEVGHDAEQGAVPTRFADARILRTLRLA